MHDEEEKKNGNVCRVQYKKLWVKAHEDYKNKSCECGILKYQFIIVEDNV